MAAARMSDETSDGRRGSRQPSLRVVAGGRAGQPGAAGARDEAALLGAWLLGDDDAFGELVRRHEPLVLSLVRRYARTPEDARDLAQRTFMKAFESARRALARSPGPAGAVPFRRWLVRVAINLSKNHLRDETRHTRAPEALPGLATAGPDASEALERAEAGVRVRRAVLRLPRRQREVLTLRLDAELPFAEIAAALGITGNAAKVSFHHAVRRLREELHREAP
jgi:RNA polymerase sigma-70 factor (ECF subfamily)